MSVIATFQQREVMRVTKVLEGLSNTVSGKKAVGRAIAKGMGEALKPLKAPIRSGTPRDTGNLRRSVAMRQRLSHRGEPWAAVGWQYKGGLNRISKMLGAEYGSDRFPDPVEILQRTWKANEAEVNRSAIGHIADVVDKVIEKEAAKNKVPYWNIGRVR